MKLKLMWKVLIFSFLAGPPAWAGKVSIGTQNLYHWMTDYEARVSRMRTEIQSGIPEIMGFQEAARWSDGESMYDEFLMLSKYNDDHYQVTNNFGFMREAVSMASKIKSHRCEGV